MASLPGGLSRPTRRASARDRRHIGTLGVRPPQDTAVPAPVPSRRRSVPAIEAAIVTAEQVLSERLAHLAWCRSVGRSTVVAETLVRSVERRLELFWQERHWRLGNENDGLGRPS